MDKISSMRLAKGWATEDLEAAWSLIRSRAAEIRPRTDDELHRWLQLVTSFSFAREASCPDHDPPFAWMADIYFDREPRVAVLAPRGGGKTQGSACVHFASGATMKLRAQHFGGTWEQANQCQAYIKEMAAKPGNLQVVSGFTYHRSTLEQDPTTSRCHWRNGSFLSIHTATEKQASGGHPQRKQADEFDLWRYEVWQKFLGMGVTRNDPDALSVQTIYTSTRSRRYGLMHNLITSANERKIKVYRYCIWDVKAPCPECLQAKCELWDWCQGKHQHSGGHIPRLVVVDKALQMDTDTIETELFCERPSERGMCWPTFDATVRQEGSNVTPRVEYNPERDVWWGCDDNYEQPRCIALCQEDPNTGFIHIFDEYYRSHRLSSEAIEDILEDQERYPYSAPIYAIPDATAAELQGALMRRGIPIFPPRNYRRAEGVKSARRFIRDARGTRMLLIHPRCKNIIRSVQAHHFKELPADPDGTPRFSDEAEKHSDDHGADVVCYICWVRRHQA